MYWFSSNCTSQVQCCAICVDHSVSLCADYFIVFYCITHQKHIYISRCLYYLSISGHSSSTLASMILIAVAACTRSTGLSARNLGTGSQEWGWFQTGSQSSTTLLRLPSPTLCRTHLLPGKTWQHSTPPLVVWTKVGLAWVVWWWGGVGGGMGTGGLWVLVVS